MMFMKVNDHTVKCMIAEQEIVEMGFQIEELCKDQERASDFMKLIIEKGNQAGYEISENVTAVQATFLPNHQIVLCFTDDATEGIVDKTIENLLRAFGLVSSVGKEKLENISKLSGQEKKDAFDACMEEAASTGEISRLEEEEPDTEQKDGVEKVLQPMRYLLEFSSMDMAEQFCKAAPAVPGKLIKNDKKYFLVADLTEEEDKTKKSFLLLSSEYTLNPVKVHYQTDYLEEHGDVLIKNHAFEVLKTL